MKKFINLFSIFLLILGGCKTSRNTNNKALPTPVEINNSDIYYDILNNVLDYLIVKKGYRIHKPNETGQVFLHSKVEIQTWNCFLYQKYNFLYYHNYVDTSYAPLNTGIPKIRFIKICEALHSSFELKKDNGKLKYEILWTDNPLSSFSTGPSPWFFSPVIDRLDGKYEIYMSDYDFEGGVGRILTLEYINHSFEIVGFELDAMDNFGCWYEEDYVSKLCK